MKNYLLASVVLLALMTQLVTGCKEDEPQAFASSGVIVRSVMDKGVPVYALIQQVQSNTPMDTAIVTDPTGSTYGLVKYHGDPYDFRLEPALESYSANPPKAGPFTYRVKFNTGEQLSLPNSIEMPYILPAQNIAVSKNAADNPPSVVLTWDAVPNAEAYSFEVTSGTDRLFHSHHLFTLEPGKNGSIKFPLSEFSAYKGKTILFKVVAYDLISNNSAINSTSWATVTWIAE
jgi:hypothetical protein